MLEAIKLISDCVTYDNPADYPFLKWWGYENVVYRQIQQNPISFEMRFDIDGSSAAYSAIISGAGGYMRFIEEKISIDQIVDIQRNGSELKIKYTDSFRNYALEHYRDFLNEFLKSAGTFGTLKLEDIFYRTVSGLNESLSLIRLDPAYFTLGARTDNADPFGVFTIAIPQQTGPMQTTSMLPILLRYYRTSKEENKYDSPLSQLVSFLRPNNPYPVSIVYSQKSGNMIFKGRSIILATKEAVNQMKKAVPINYSSKNMFTGQQAVISLFRMFNGRGIPKPITEAMSTLFPGWNIAFNINPDGTINLKVIDDNHNMSLSPPNIPDGFFKALFLLTMLYSEPRPSIVLIDEFENSLHNTIIDHIIDLYRNADDICTIITTHSPLVIDAVDIEDISILEYDNEKGCTVIKKFEKPNELRNKLAEQGLSPSDYWLYSD